MNTNCGIYCFENLINGKKYIGESINIQSRHQHHLYAYKNELAKNYNLLLYTDMRLYGINNFKFSILENCSKDMLLERESFYIQQYDTVRNGYNSVVIINGRIVFYAKYNPDIIEKIKYFLSDKDMSVTDVSRLLNIPRTTVSMINNGNMHYDDNVIYPLHAYKPHKSKHYVCCDCGIEISKNSVRCSKCNILYRQNKPLDIISKTELEILLNKGFNYTEIGRAYGVSGNSVKKWCKKYGLYEYYSKIPDKSLLVDLLNSYSISDIAFMYDVHKSTVSDWITKYNLRVLSANRVLCVETNIIYNTKRDAARIMFPDVNPKDSAFNISKAARLSKSYRGYHWILLPQEVLLD